MKQGALFDLDGVLIDTEGIYSEFWSRVGREYGVPYDDFSDRIKGTTLQQILGTYFAPELHPELVRRLEQFEDTMEYRIFPGVADFLQQLSDHGIECAIVTSSNDEKMAHLWSQHPGLRRYFKAVITDGQVTRSKPDPEPYLKGAEALGCKPERCIVFEDSFNGLLSGRRAGATVIGLATTNPASQLAGKADLVIDNIEGFTYEQMQQACRR